MCEVGSDRRSSASHHPSTCASVTSAARPSTVTACLSLGTRRPAAEGDRLVQPQHFFSSLCVCTVAPSSCQPSSDKGKGKRLLYAFLRHRPRFYFSDLLSFPHSLTHTHTCLIPDPGEYYAIHTHIHEVDIPGHVM